MPTPRKGRRSDRVVDIHALAIMRGRMDAVDFLARLECPKECFFKKYLYKTGRGVRLSGKYSGTGVTLHSIVCPKHYASQLRDWVRRTAVEVQR